MVNQLNKEIEDKLNEIIKFIKESDSFKRYLKAKEILDTRDDLKIKIEKIKKIQKEIIKHRDKLLENELNNLINDLNNDITYNEYNKYLIEVNNMLAIFEEKLNKYFYDVFNQEFFMSDNLLKAIEIDNEITDMLIDGLHSKDEIMQSFTLKLSKILEKLNNKEILYLLQNGNGIHEIIDVLNFLKKYKINKKELELDNSYTDELKKLNNFIELINDSSINEDEYMYICSKCDVDNVASFLLSKMSNDDIMKLSNETDDWNYKLFLYGNLKA